MTARSAAKAPDCRILLVEDDEANLLVATTLLEIFGYEFHAVQSGLEAVERVKTGFYQIIIMDVRLKGIDGLEAARRIRNFESATGHAPVQILCVTAYAMTGEKERCVEAGMDDYLSKPFNIDILQDKLAALRSKAQIAAAAPRRLVNS